MRPLALLTAGLLAGWVPAAPVPKALKKVTTMDGTWEVAERHLGGVRDDSRATTRWPLFSAAISLWQSRTTLHSSASSRGGG